MPGQLALSLGCCSILQQRRPGQNCEFFGGLHIRVVDKMHGAPTVKLLYFQMQGEIVRQLEVSIQ